MQKRYLVELPPNYMEVRPLCKAVILSICHRPDDSVAEYLYNICYVFLGKVARLWLFAAKPVIIMSYDGRHIQNHRLNMKRKFDEAS